MTAEGMSAQAGPKPVYGLSVVIPFYDEEDNIQPLYDKLAAELPKINRSYELVFVNDGSKDGTLERLVRIAESDPAAKVVNLRRNYGQTAAMKAGFDHARGDIIVAMDGDGQNDPADIQRLLELLDEGYDVVSGWRKNRQDRALSRKVPSVAANWLISRISGVKLHDYGCSLKAYRRSIIKDVRLYGEMHRFIPIYAMWQGGRVTELVVEHHPRLHGASNYGLNRIFKVLLDLLLIMFMERYMTKPIYFFGGLGILFMGFGFIGGLWAVWLKLFEGTSFIQTPLPVLVAMSFTTGAVCVLMGVLSELIIRTYYESQGLRIYQVRETYNLNANPED